MCDITDRIKKDYKNLAKDYEQRWKNFVSPVRHWVLNRLKYSKDTSFNVLDLGCGTGGTLYMVAEEYPNAILTGFDVSPDMLGVAKDKLSNFPNKTLKALNIEALEAEKLHYDVIISMFVFHHIVDQNKLLETIIHSAKSGGDIYIADYAVDSVPMRLAEMYWRLFLPSHYKAHSSRRLKIILESNEAIEIIDSAYFSPNWFWRQQAYHLKKK